MRRLIGMGRHRRFAPRQLSTRGLWVWAAVFRGLSFISGGVLIWRGSLLLREVQNVPLAQLTLYGWVIFVSTCMLCLALTLYAGALIFRIGIMAKALSKRLIDQVAEALAKVDRPSSPRIPGLD